jgi:hypothetical protein
VFHCGLNLDLADNSYVEDPAGCAISLTIMNVAPSPVILIDSTTLAVMYPVGAHVAIREPFVKMGLAGRPTIRVDVPTDFELVYLPSPLIKNVQWRFAPAVSCLLSLLILGPR